MPRTTSWFLINIRLIQHHTAKNYGLWLLIQYQAGLWFVNKLVYGSCECTRILLGQSGSSKAQSTNSQPTNWTKQLDWFTHWLANLSLEAHHSAPERHSVPPAAVNHPPARCAERRPRFCRSCRLAATRPGGAPLAPEMYAISKQQR